MHIVSLMMDCVFLTQQNFLNIYMEKGLDEIRNTFVFKDFKGNSPTVEQDGDAIYLLDDKKRKLPIEYASVIMDKIGHITPLCFDIAVYYKIVTGEYKEKDLLNIQMICNNTVIAKNNTVTLKNHTKKKKERKMFRFLKYILYGLAFSGWGMFGGLIAYNLFK